MVSKSQSASKLLLKTPVVVVLGHVDHGKTTLLDTIRKSNTAQGEAGQITQRIGAYQIEVKSQEDEEINKITFIDTPGHEAFSKMRVRGAAVSDFAVLVVSATDGVMPQTIESITHIKQAGIPLIVAINKTDLPDSNPDRVKQQLAQHGILVEGYGGNTVAVPLSAKTGKGIDQLLEVILLLSEMNGLTVDPIAGFEGVVVEAQKDKTRGVTATIIPHKGTLMVGMDIFTDTAQARVKAMFDENGGMVKSVLPGKPVAVMGFKALPAIGAKVSQTRFEVKNQIEQVKALSMEEVLLASVKHKHLQLIIRADSGGSLEALTENLPKDVHIVNATVGDITESDVLLASGSKAIIIGFNVKTLPAVERLAQEENVRIKIYSLIYDLLTEINDVMEILKNPEAQETDLGTAVIIAEFPFEDLRVAGCRVIEGRIVRGDTIKLMRQNSEIGRTRIRSLQQGKEKVDKIEKGVECGIILDKKLDFKMKDSIIAYKTRGVL